MNYAQASVNSKPFVEKQKAQQITPIRVIGDVAVVPLTENQMRPHVSLIIPALNEEKSIGSVLRAIPRQAVGEIIVVDNGSTDRTADVARHCGAKLFRNRHAVTARRVGWLRTLLIGAVVLVGYAPFLSAGQNLFAGFLKFAREWQFNAGAFALIRSAAENFSDEPAVLARYICGILILGIVVWLVWRDDLSEKTFVKSAAIILGALIVLSLTVMPWYLSWVLPFAVLARQNIWFYFSALVLTAFHILIDLNEYALALWFEHGLFFALVFGQLWLRRRALKTSLKTGLIPAFAGKNVNPN